MAPEQLRAAALTQLNLVLGFFSRAESRLTLVLGVDLSMLALLTSAAPPVTRWTAGAAIVLVPLFCIGWSLGHIWHGLFPNVTGGKLDANGSKSIVFFGTVAERSESQFIEDFNAQSDESYTRDLLGQVWTNSNILSLKFSHLKHAFLWMLIALIPWLVTLGVFAAMNPDAKTLLR